MGFGPFFPWKNLHIGESDFSHKTWCVKKKNHYFKRGKSPWSHVIPLKTHILQHPKPLIRGLVIQSFYWLSEGVQPQFFFFPLPEGGIWLAHHQFFWNIGQPPNIEACFVTLPFDTPLTSYIHGSWTMAKQYGIKNVIGNFMGTHREQKNSAPLLLPSPKAQKNKISTFEPSHWLHEIFYFENGWPPFPTWTKYSYLNLRVIIPDLNMNFPPFFFCF